MITQLAQAAATDPMISGQWLLSVIPILASAAALIIGRTHWKSLGAKEATSGDVTLRKPVPTIETREKPVYALKSDVEAALRRFQDSHNKCQIFQDSQHAANAKRLDDQVKALARMEGTLTSVQETTNTLLAIALQRKPNSRA